MIKDFKKDFETISKFWNKAKNPEKCSSEDSKGKYIKINKHIIYTLIKGSAKRRERESQTYIKSNMLTAFKVASNSQV